MHASAIFAAAMAVTLHAIAYLAPPDHTRPAVFAPTPPPTVGVVTSELAYWDRTHPSARHSPDWDMTSGTLLSARTPAGWVFWTGPPDTVAPPKGTNSAVFRLTSRRADFGDVTVSVTVTVGRLLAGGTPWDGIHLFLRYQGEASLYYASIARRDGAVVVKKKCPGGPSNGGTYYTLGSAGGHPIAYRAPVAYGATIHTGAGGAVTVTVARGGRTALTAVDRGQGCAPITKPGAVGIRGDNADFTFTNYQARAA